MVVKNSSGEPEPEESPTILIVDDEDIVLKASCRVLEMGGYAVVTASRGREAVDLFRTQVDKIGAVLLDLNMPEMKGEDVLREIRTVRPTMPIILTSGYDEDEIAGTLLGDGLTGFIQKPFRPMELMDCIHSALSWGSAA